MDAEPRGQNDNLAAAAIGERLAARYRHIAETAMADVPICNAALAVASCDFRAWGGQAIGIVVTPWFMNLIATALPGTDVAPTANGSSVRLALPSGEVEFIAGDLEGIGRIDACSLFSPVLEFETMEAAVETAREAMRAFFDVAALAEPPKPPSSVNRRDLLRGRLTVEEGA